MMTKYFRLCEGLDDKGKLVPVDASIQEYLKKDKDYYISLYSYNDEQLKQFNESGTVSGITKVTTNKLVFDFDSEDDLGKAARDTKTLCQRLKLHGIPDAQITFSGGKGFHVEVETDKQFTPDEFKNIVYNLAKGLDTFDPRIWNASRVIRVSNTKHQKTGLYKIPITYDTLDESFEVLKEKAKVKPTVQPEHKLVKLPDAIYMLKDKKLTMTQVSGNANLPTIQIDTKSLNFKEKPNWMSNCLFSLSMGRFKKGERHDAFHRLAVTYYQQGFPQNVIIKMLEGVADLQHEYTGDVKHSGRDIYSEVSSIMNDKWKKCQYTCKKDEWMHSYCSRLGEHACSAHGGTNVEVYSIDEMIESFERFAKNIDSYIIKTGINKLDDKLKLMVGNVLGILAAPSAGKSSFTMTILNNMSKNGVESLFLSYDMFQQLLAQRIIQKHKKFNMDDLYNIYRNNKHEIQKEINDILKEEYSNVSFCFKSGQTVDEIEQNVIKLRTEVGKNIRVVAVDYLELVNGEANDPTQASANIAAKLKNMATKLEVLVILILQPQKVASTPDEPIKSFNNAKGSGMISQSVSYFLGCHREGLNPDYPGMDKFFSVRCLKNRTGELFNLDFSWEGVAGSIRDLTKTEEMELASFKKQKEDDAKESKKNNGGDYDTFYK